MRSLFRTGSDDNEEDNEGLEDEHGNPMGDQVELTIAKLLLGS